MFSKALLKTLKETLSKVMVPDRSDEANEKTVLAAPAAAELSLFPEAKIDELRVDELIVSADSISDLLRLTLAPELPSELT